MTAQLEPTDVPNSSTAPLATPTPVPAQPRSTLQVVGAVWLIVLAILLFTCGACSGLFFLFAPLTSRNPAEDLTSNLVFGPAAAFGVLYAILLAWQGINILRGRDSLPAARAFPPTIIFGLVFFLGLLLGVGALVAKQLAPYLFPPWHFIVASIPPIAFVGYAARRLGQSSGFRALLTSFTWGVLGATSLAIIIEIIAGIVIVLVVAIFVVLNPASQTYLEEIQRALGRSPGRPDPRIITQLVTNPVIAIGMLLYFAAFVPVVEEIVKTLVVAFANPARTQLQDAVLWGIAAGAGFAIFENIFNTGTASNEWALVMVTRIGATTMHVANGVTMGRGWYAARVERRWGKLATAFGASVILHALWNAIAIVMSGSALVGLNEPITATTLMQPASWLAIALAFGLIVLTLLGMVWIVYSIRAVRAPAQNSQGKEIEQP